MFVNNAVAVALATYVGLTAASPLPNQREVKTVARQASGKRGIVYNDANLANTFKSQCESCSWAYNWDSARNGLDSSLNFAPMLWKDGDNWTPQWDANVEQALSEGSTHLLSFNEPDLGEQANMTPDQAADSHINWLNKYADRASIGSPAVSNSGDPAQGLGWLRSFMEACDARGGCAIDFCNIHWYSNAEWQDTLIDHISQAHDVCGGRPIWLTEFAANDADIGILSGFVTDMIPRLEEIEYLERYSYFMVSVGRLMNSESDLSEYGRVYATI